MKIEMCHDSKIASIWLTQAEREDPAVKAQLDALCADCKGKKYTVAIFHSGPRPIQDQTAGLLTYNRRKLARIAGRG